MAVVEPGDFDVHLDAGDALLGAAHLEVHVAEVVLVAEDVREDGDLLAFLHQAHGDARHRRLDGDARVHERQRAAADGGHGARAVGLEDVGHHADGVGELLALGQHVAQRALGEGAVPNLAAARAAQGLGLAHAEGREVVVEHELPERLAGQELDALLVVARPQAWWPPGPGSHRG